MFQVFAYFIDWKRIQEKETILCFPYIITNNVKKNVNQSFQSQQKLVNN